jgi:hypothetical protein
MNRDPMFMRRKILYFPNVTSSQINPQIQHKSNQIPTHYFVDSDKIFWSLYGEVKDSE